MSTRYIGRIIHGRTAHHIVTVMIFLTLLAGCGKTEPTPTATSQPTNTSTPTGTGSPTATPTTTTDPRIPVFSKSNQTLGNTRSFGLAIADVDLDNDEDILFANYIGSSRLWINDGNGTFTGSSQTFNVSECHDVAIADLTGDGYPDIFLLGHASPSKVYFNDGSGGFADSQQNIGIGTESPGMIVLGDVDDDGDIDALISHYEIPNRVLC